MNKFSDKKWDFLIVLLFIFLGFLLYSNTFHSPFLFDDLINIVNNSHIRLTKITWDSISKIFSGTIWYRPLPTLSFALNYYFWQYQVVGYHAVNIVIHVMTGLLLFFFLQTTLTLLQKQPTSFLSKNSRLIAFFAALMWFVHPLCTQSVTYIMQRMNSMATMFYILSFWFYAKLRLSPKSSYLWFVGCAVSGICAFLSKEISLTLPFFIYLYEWYFFQNLNKKWFIRNIKWILLAFIPVIFIGIVHYTGMNPTGKISAYYREWDFTLSQRLISEFRIVIYYISLIFYPHPSRLNFDFDFQFSHSLIVPWTTLFSLIIIIGLIGTACCMAKKERLISFCIFWYFGNIII